MTHKIVAMPLIQGQIRRGRFTRSELHYARYSKATWRWWCKKNGIEFVVFEKPLGGTSFSDMPPTVQRWFIPKMLIEKYGERTRVAVVDADTIIRADTPDFLERSNDLSAVRGRDGPWIARSVRAFQHLFPETALSASDYFNVGIVVVGQDQLNAINAFLDFASANWPQLKGIIQSGNFGTDQTVLNFILRRENVAVDFMPLAFNFLHCFPLDPGLFMIENSPLPDPIEFAARAFSRPGTFDFCNQGYIWHFSNLVSMRSLVMGEVWRRVRESYPGAQLDE